MHHLSLTTEVQDESYKMNQTESQLNSGFTREYESTSFEFCYYAPSDANIYFGSEVLSTQLGLV